MTLISQVFDDTLDSFSAVHPGHQDFELTPLRIYSGSVLDETQMPSPGEGNDDNQIVVHFDYATGAIVREDNYAKAKIEPSQLEERDSKVW